VQDLVNLSDVAVGVRDIDQLPTMVFRQGMLASDPSYVGASINALPAITCAVSTHVRACVRVRCACCVLRVACTGA
jgi:hypothetical protein